MWLKTVGCGDLKLHEWYFAGAYAQALERDEERVIVDKPCEEAAMCNIIMASNKSRPSLESEETGIHAGATAA